MSSLDMESQIGVLQETVDELMGRIAEMENRVGTSSKLTQMTVTDSGCRLKKTVDDKIENMDGEIKPVYVNVIVNPDDSDSPATVAVPNPYLFYAAETVIEDDSQEVPAREVQIVLPVGGSLSGLYRFPRVGERILVAETDGGNFLMGYLPSSLVPFLDSYTESGENGENILKTLEQKGEVLRYKTRGASPSADNFSEIGFYSHEADWAIKEGKGEDKEFVYTDAEKTQLAYPLLDQLKLQSTGDIRSTAGNHHLIQAKRFEILAGCDEVNHRTDTTEDGERPLGDNLGDDSALHGGDVH
ncbi:MAG: hypothetical protein LBK62_03420, partial [Treponema sp.]|nr:hypothetical protein [Treponema sp.]